MLFWSRRRRESQWDYFTVIENNLSGEVFDPTITTVLPTTIAWISSDGYALVTIGTTHDMSYTVPADGPRTWNIFCSSGLNNIKSFDMNTDKVVHIDVSLLLYATSMTAHTNASLVMALTDLPVGLKYAYFYSDPSLTGDISTLPVGLTTANFSSDSSLTGDISTLPVGLTTASFYGVSSLTGDISTLPVGLTIADFSSVSSLTGDIATLPVGLTYASFYSDSSLTGDISTLPVGLKYAYFYSDPSLTGDISTLPVGLTTAYFYSDPSLTAGSVSTLTLISNLRLYSNGWNAASIDIVLLSISNAIHANVNHFTYATPSLQIGGSNAAPGGTPAAATTSPLVTPGSGNSDTDWQWDAGAGKHKALTGMAAIWIMRNNTGHAWTVTATGVA